MMLPTTANLQRKSKIQIDDIEPDNQPSNLNLQTEERSPSDFQVKISHQ